MPSTTEKRRSLSADELSADLVDPKQPSEADTELDYEEEVFLNNGAQTTVDEDLSPTKSLPGSESDNHRPKSSSDGEYEGGESPPKKASKRKKRRKRRKKSKKQKRHKRRRRYSSSSSSSSSSSTSSSGTDSPPTKHSTSRAKDEEQVTMTKSEYQVMKDMYEKMEKFYEEHHKDDPKAAEASSDSNRPTQGKFQFRVVQQRNIHNAVPGASAEINAAAANESETTILSRLIKPIQSNQEPVKTTTPKGVVGPLGSSELEDNQVISSGDAAMFSSDEFNKMSISDPVGEEDDRLRRAMNQPGWSKQVEAAQARADKLIRDAELNKAEIIKPPGESKFTDFKKPRNVIDLIARDEKTDRCDELHSMTSAHVSKSIHSQIERGQFVELHLLRPMERDEAFKDKRLKFTNEDGETYYVPPAGSKDRESGPGSIYNFKTWQQCFRVYSEIYAKANPTKASEIIDYCQAIETASTIYIWDNVACYDRLFRLHMAEFPHREWFKRYQRAYEVAMKETLASRNLFQQAKRVTSFAGGRSKSKACWRYNKHGKCYLGDKCEQDHKCNRCGAFGHPGVHCKKDSTRFPQKEGKGEPKGEAKK